MYIHAYTYVYIYIFTHTHTYLCTYAVQLIPERAVALTQEVLSLVERHLEEVPLRGLSHWDSSWYNFIEVSPGFTMALW